ncbi:resolvase [Vulcanococcus sp.]|uniref:resolvase n=1 Tax=Vulcanococcus sp. TaxID=2856995 RepID=UPI0037DA6E21
MSGLVALDPGRSKCGLVLSDHDGLELLAAGVLPAPACLNQIQTWAAAELCHTVLLGNGTGSAPWRQWLAPLPLQLLVVPEAGTTLAARRRYWQLEPPRGWRRLLPEGLRLPPRDVDDVVAQLLLERHLRRSLQRSHCRWLSGDDGAV